MKRQKKAKKKTKQVLPLITDKDYQEFPLVRMSEFTDINKAIQAFLTGEHIDPNAIIGPNGKKANDN